VFPFLFIIYLPLLLKGANYITGLEKGLRFLPSLLGRIEYLLSPLRDTIVAFGMAVFSIYHFFRIGYEPFLVLLIALSILSLINRLHRRKFRLQLCRSILKWDNVEPKTFFRIYYRCLGSFFPQVPEAVAKVPFSDADYRRGRSPRRTIRPLIIGGLKTATLAKLAILAMQKLEKDGVDAFDAFARLWGATFLTCAYLRLKTEGVEKLPPLQGKTLLVFNHKSYLDFALNFFALGEIRNKGRHLRPRFIAAKDHFIDNPLIYSWLGVGKCIEKAGMIFINRRKGKGWLAMKEAAERLAESDVEVAVYPQGTRAWGLKDESGRRIDAGYYTTLSKKTLEDPKGHLKKGTAQLILDTAMRLREKGEPPLKILFIGIDGTATVGPKGSFKIQTESEVFFRIGALWKVELAKELPFENPQGSAPSNEAQENYLDELEALHAQLDREMEKSIGRHRTLTERAGSDPRIPKGAASALRQFLQRADATENILPFKVLDRIYALPPARWKNHLEHFTHLALERTDNAGAWDTFNREVSLELIQK
jgi:1-acyl-sn-glycerol-3-phosphate acyltransferase